MFGRNKRESYEREKNKKSRAREEKNFDVNQLLEVQKLLQELTEHQDQILESIPLTEDAVLWASHTREFIEQVEKLPEYTKKAQAIEAEMQNLTKRIQRAKERVQKLNS